MPRKPKPQAATAATYSLTVTDGVFGGTCTATVTPAPTERVGVKFSIQADGGGEAGEVIVDAFGQAIIVCGPTPSWSSGGGTGSAEVVAHRNPDDDSDYVIVSPVVSFTVLP